MVIKNLAQGIEIEAGKCIYNVVSEGGQGGENFPPIQSNFALGSTWTDTSISEGEPWTVKWELKEVDSEPAWVLADPLTLTEDEKLYDVSGVNHVYVEIAEDEGGGGEGDL